MTWVTWHIFTRALEKFQNSDCDGIILFKVENARAYNLYKICLMKIKNNAKFEEETTSRFKTDTTNFTNYDPSTQNSQIFALWWGPFEQSLQWLSWKSTEELCSKTLKCDEELQENLTCGFENDMTSMANFH